MTVAENIVYQAALHGIGRRAAIARGEALLDRVSLADVMGKKVGALSGGQARRVEIARALLHEPQLLLCDEATAGLDVKSRADIVQDIHRLASDEGIGVLWATHLVDEIWPDDPVVVLHKGSVMATETASDIAGDSALADAFLAMTGDAA
ncbi:MAG: ATP-binding cassette domain-containing protein [Pseudomonadota bacterium]